MVTPLEALERLRKKDSLGSTLVSPLMVTETVCVSPALPAKMRVPLEAM